MVPSVSLSFQGIAMFTSEHRFCHFTEFPDAAAADAGGQGGGQGPAFGQQEEDDLCKHASVHPDRIPMLTVSL